MKPETPEEISRSTKLIRKKIRAEGYKLASFYREIAEQPMKGHVVYILCPQMGVFCGYVLMIAWGRLSLSVVFAHMSAFFDIFSQKTERTTNTFPRVVSIFKGNKGKESSNRI